MRRSLRHLSPEKQTQLAKINDIIQNIAKKTIGTEMVILFGSYARGDYVEKDITIHEGNTLSYQSDFDILIVTKKPVYEMQMRLAREIENKIHKDTSIDTPVSILVEDIYHINARLEENRYFYLDIKKEGIALYDSKKYKLADAKKLSKAQQQALKQEDFTMRYKNGTNTMKFFRYGLQEKLFRGAAFNLHQATESYITAYLLVKTGYKPKTHDLEVLYTKVQELDVSFIDRFDLSDTKNSDTQHFKLLSKAYVDARYSKSYHITKKQLLYLEKKLKKLKRIVKKLCKDILQDT